MYPMYPILDSSNDDTDEGKCEPGNSFKGLTK
jgi:hypothetical protein